VFVLTVPLEMEGDEVDKAVLVDASDEEMFVDLESDEVDSYGMLLNDVASLLPVVVDSSDTGGETCAESENASDLPDVSEPNYSIVISSSTSCTAVSFDTGDIEGVFGHVHDDTVSVILSEAQTPNTVLEQTITTCNSNGEGRTTFSQATAANVNGDSSSGDQMSLLEHSVPAVMRVETTDDEAIVSGSTAEDNVAPVIISSSSISSLSTSETDLMHTDPETSGAGQSESSAVCSRKQINRAGRSNLIDVLQAKSVNVHKLAAYTGLKFPQIMVTRVDVLPVPNNSEVQSEGNECSIALSSVTADFSPGAEVSSPEVNEVSSFLPPVEESHGHVEDHSTADTVISTRKCSVSERVPSTYDVIAVIDNSLLPDENVPSVSTTSHNTGPPVVESPCQSVGLKRAHVDELVEGSPAKQQKIEVSSSLLSAATYDDVSAACFDAFSTAEYSVITEAFEPAIFVNVGAVETTDVDNSQPMSTSESTGLNEDLVIEEQIVDDSVIDAVAGSDNALASEDAMSGLLSVAIAEAINDTSLVPDTSDVATVNSVFNADSSSQNQQEVAWISTDMEADEVYAAGDSSTADTSNPQLWVMSGSNEYVIIEQQMAVDTVAGSDTAVASEDVMSGLLSVAIAEAMTSTSTTNVVSNSADNESYVDAMENSEVLSSDVVTGNVAGACRAVILPPPPPTVTKNAGSKMRMRMEAANKDNLPASATVKNCLKNKLKTAASKDTLGAHQTTAVGSRDVESSHSASETEPEGQTWSSDEKKVEPLMEWRPPPTKTGTVKDITGNVLTTEGDSASGEKLFSEQLHNQTENQKPNKLPANKKKVTPLMECKLKPSRRQTSATWNVATDSSPVIEWKPAPSHNRSKSAPMELGQQGDKNIEPSLLPLRSQSENISFDLPRNDQDLRTPALGGQQLP